MTIDFKFEIGQKVKLVPLEGFGRIVGLRFYGQGSEYNVRYFNNGEEKSIWFYEDELELGQK